MKEIQRMKKEHRKKKVYKKKVYKKKEILREIKKQGWVPVGNIFVNRVLWVFLMKELKNTSTKKSDSTSRLNLRFHQNYFSLQKLFKTINRIFKNSKSLIKKFA